MNQQLPSTTTGLPLQPLPTAARWALLLAASAVTAAALQWARLPAALLLGPLAAAVLVQTAGGAVKIPRAFVAAAQAVIGCLVAHSITPSIVGGFAVHWPVFLGVVVLSLAASVAIGWAMSRFRVVPGTTAVWGMLPGAAVAMMVMAEAHGADFRLVAFMQYLRVVLVAAAASVAALLFGHGGGLLFAGGYFPPVDLPNLAATAAVALVGGGVGLASRIPAGALLGPFALGAVLNVLGWATIELPPVVADRRLRAHRLEHGPALYPRRARRRRPGAPADLGRDSPLDGVLRPPGVDAGGSPAHRPAHRLPRHQPWWRRRRCDHRCLH